MGPPTPMGLVAICILDSSLHAFAAPLQGMLAARVGAAVPSPSPYAPMGKVAKITLLHLYFACGVTLDGDLPPICEAAAQGKGRMERIATLNQSLMQVLASCLHVFGGRTHFSSSFFLLTFVKNLSLLNPFLEPDCTRWGFTLWLTRQ